MELGENYFNCSTYKQKSHSLACHRNCDRAKICFDLSQFDKKLHKRILDTVLENSGVEQLKLPEWRR